MPPESTPLDLADCNESTAFRSSISFDLAIIVTYVKATVTAVARRLALDAFDPRAFNRTKRRCFDRFVFPEGSYF